MQSQPSGPPGALDERAADRSAFDWRFVAPLCIGAALNPINSTMVATALATIGERLHAGADQTVWLISVLYLTSAISQPVAGRIADRIGPRKVFVTGSVIVALAGVAGIFVHTLWGLVALRALIGSGTGAVYPAAMAMVRRRADSLGLPPPNRVLGWLSTASLTTLTIGPLLAGLLVQTVGWQWIFIVNLPLALLCLVLVLRFAPRDTLRAAGERADLDPGGIALFGVAIVALLFFLMQLRDARWWILGGAAAVVVALVYYERTRDRPFVDVRMLAANRALLITYGRIVASFVVLYGAMFGLSQWFEQARGLSPIQVGLLMLLIFGIGAFLSTIGSRFTAVRTPLVIGAFGMIGGSLLMVGVDSRSAVWLFALMCLAHSPSAGLSMLANQMAIYVQAPADQIGMASGLSRTAQYLGAIIGSGIIALAFGARPTDGGLHLVGWILTGVGTVVALAVVLDRSLHRKGPA